jgi:hypothetical protein
MEENVILACSDGYLRYIGGNDDDGTNIESHILLGPLQLGTIDKYGMIERMVGALGQSSGTVTWRIVLGNSAEEAADNAVTAIGLFQAGSDYSSYVQSYGFWTAGQSHQSYPRARSMWACLWLQSTARWAFEGITMKTTSFGSYK